MLGPKDDAQTRKTPVLNCFRQAGDFPAELRRSNLPLVKKTDNNMEKIETRFCPKHMFRKAGGEGVHEYALR